MAWEVPRAAENHPTRGAVDEIMVPLKRSLASGSACGANPTPGGYGPEQLGASWLWSIPRIGGWTEKNTQRSWSWRGSSHEDDKRSSKRDLNYKVFADNFLLNIPLVEALKLMKAKSIYFVRTFRANTFKSLSLKSEGAEAGRAGSLWRQGGWGACDVKVDGEPVMSTWMGSLWRQGGLGACDVKVDGEPVTSRWTGRACDVKVELMSKVVAVRWFNNKTMDCGNESHNTNDSTFGLYVEELTERAKLEHEKHTLEVQVSEATSEELDNPENTSVVDRKQDLYDSYFWRWAKHR